MDENSGGSFDDLGREGGEDTPSVKPAYVHTLGCTLAEYAQFTCLPTEYLQDLGLSDISYCRAPALRIPYRDANGGEPAVRIRKALQKTEHGDNRFCWRKRSKLGLYGLWCLRSEPFVTIVEGESDCHVGWYHGINVVGVPGSYAWNEARDAPHLTSFDKINVVIEPDQGGEATLRWVAKSALRNRIWIVRLDGFKDLRAMHIADPALFQERWQAALDDSKPWGSLAAQQEDVTREIAWSACQDLATDSDILGRFASDLRRAGAVGVDREAKLLYLAMTSRVLDRPISAAIKGPSSAGKSFLVEMVLSFFSTVSYYALTAMSERALAYSEEPLKHRILVLYEAEGMSGDTASYLIRSLLSEGCLRYETVEKTQTGMRARLIEREGPTGLIVTTTREGLHPENETRLISLTLADGQDQTRAILDALADEDRRDEVDRAPWHAFQDFIAASDWRVTIAFAKVLVSLIPPLAVRLRRDTKLLLNLVRTHALLHQASRERDDMGRVVATLDDYAAVHALVAHDMAEGVQASVPPTVRVTVEAVRDIVQQIGSATTQAVGDALKIDQSAASRRCLTAQKKGFIQNEETSRGRPARYVIANPMPAEKSVLPSPDVLKAAIAGDLRRESVCTSAGEPAGDRPPPPDQVPGSRRRRIVL